MPRDTGDRKAATFPHEKLDLYPAFLHFAGLSERIVISAQGCAVADQLERATESIGANLIRGNSQWSPALRITSFDVSFASALECAACLDVCAVKELIDNETATEGKRCLYSISGMLLGLRKRSARSVREDVVAYGVPVFSHERLDVYRLGLDFVRWMDVFMKRGALRAQEAKKLDSWSTSVVLNIAEGNGKFTCLDQVKFVGVAHTAALQCVLHLDLMVARGRVPERDVFGGKAMLARVCAMLMGWRRQLGGSNDSVADGDADSGTE